MKSFISPVLVGRAREMSLLHNALQTTAQHAGTCLLLTGEAGIGKSRLLEELYRLPERQDFLSLRGNCFEQDQAFPSAPWSDLIRSFHAEHKDDEARNLLRTGAADFVKLVPELARIFPDLHLPLARDPETEKRRLFEALAQFVMELADSHPLVITLEDVHWADEASLDLIHFLARRIAHSRVLLIATYRRDEPSPHLTHLLAQFDRTHLAQEIVLTPLSRNEIALMVQAIFDIDRPIKADSLDVIARLTEGNPFFIEEVLKALVEPGDISLADGNWERKSADELRLPRTVRDVVQYRLGKLNPSTREILLWAAIVGQRFSFSLLQELTRMNEPQLIHALKELIEVRLITEESGDQFAFRHALTREAVYKMVLIRERKRYHLAIAETLKRLYHDSGENHSSELAHHFYYAEAWQQASEYSRRAGEYAQTLYAPREAIVHFTHALQAARQLGIEPIWDIVRARGKQYEIIGDYESAQADYTTALKQAQSSGDKRAEWQSLLDLGYVCTGRDYQQAGNYFQQALTRARELREPVILGQTLNRLGNWYLNIDQPFEGQQYHQEALGIFEEMHDSHGIAETLELLGVVSHGCADAVLAKRYCERAIPLFRQIDDRQGQVHSLMHSLLPILSDTEVTVPLEVQQLLRAGETALDIAREMDWRAGESMVMGNLAECLIPLGEYSAAFHYLQDARAIAEELGHREGIAVTGWMQGQIYFDLLAFPQAQAQFESSLQMAQAGGSIMFSRLATAALALTYIAQNDLARAQTLLEPMLTDDAMLTRPQRMCWCARAELALKQNDPALALNISARLISSSPNANEYGTRAMPRLIYLRGQALVELGQKERALAEMSQALDGATWLNKRPLLWRILVNRGKLYRALRQKDEAERDFASARAAVEELASSVPDATLRESFIQRAHDWIPVSRILTPRQAATRAFGGLTTREREVAVLIARGKSNRAIADALVISEKTTERHVANILAKLGFNSRAQIAVWAVEKGLNK